MSDQSAGRAPENGPPVHDAALDAVMATWVAGTTDTIDSESALARVNARRQVEPTDAVDELAARRAMARGASARVPMWQQPVFRRAAALVAVVGVAAIWRASMKSPADAHAPNSHVTAIGASRDITLPDGTSMRLGPASSIELAAGFGADNRRVTLHGEAWFQVTHDARRPFAITVGTTTVEDVGTAFMVRESPSREVSVRVVEGVVRVRTRGVAPGLVRDTTVTLQAGDRAVASASGIAVAAGVVTAAEGAALSTGRLAFTDASMVEVQDALHRWYGVTLLLPERAVATRHVTADLTGEPVARVAAVLGLTLGVTADVRGDTITLHTSGAPARP